MYVRTHGRTFETGFIRSTLSKSQSNKINQNNAKFGRVLQPLAWIWNGAILEEVGR